MIETNKRDALIAILAALLVSTLLPSISAYSGPDGSGICTCSDTCSDCNTALGASGCLEVQLTNDLIDQTGTCIQMVPSKTFNCNGYDIAGSGDFASVAGISIQSIISGATVQDCTLTDWINGIVVDSSIGVNLQGNTVGRSLDDGISILDSSSTTLSGNTIQSNARYGIYLNPTSVTNAVLSNEVCDNTADDISDANGGNTLNENTCSSGCDNPCPTKSYSISGSTCTVSGNCASISEALADVSCSEVKITSNVNDFSAGNCVLFQTNNKVLDCQGNTIDGNEGDIGIVVSGNSGITIKDCVLTDWENGISLTDVASSTVKDVEVSSGGTGVYLLRSTGNTLSSILANNNDNGIYLRESSTGNTISTATLTDNGASGILFAMSSTGNTLRDSFSISSNSVGVNLDTSSGSNTLLRNNVCGNSQQDILSLSSNPGGADNICELTSGWDDAGETGCTYSCSATTNPECNSCLGCTQKLESPLYPLVEMSANIDDDVTLQCINITRPVTFDCKGHSIIGNELGRGIDVSSTDTVHVRNCVIEDWGTAVTLTSTTDSILTNIDASSNGRGLQITSNSADNYISDSTFCLNGPPDVDNQGSGTSGSNNKCDGNTNWGSGSCSEPCSQIDVSLNLAADISVGFDGDPVEWTYTLTNNDPVNSVDVVVSSDYLADNDLSCDLTPLTLPGGQSVVRVCNTVLDAPVNGPRGDDCSGAHATVTADIDFNSPTGLIETSLLASDTVTIGNTLGDGDCEFCGGETCFNAQSDCGSCPADFWLLEIINNTASSDLRFMLEYDVDGYLIPGKIAGVSFTVWDDTK